MLISWMDGTNQLRRIRQKSETGEPGGVNPGFLAAIAVVRGLTPPGSPLLSETSTDDADDYSLIIRVSEYRFRPLKLTPIGQSKSGEAEIMGVCTDTTTTSPL